MEDIAEGSVNATSDPWCGKVDWKNRPVGAPDVPHDAGTNGTRMLPILTAPDGEGGKPTLHAVFR